ncbi:hypothetical protein [Streptomyces sp. NPDC058066]|uniref:hypothetical protein n=1 Tax=Streptomyces sp. NPDC058066 TaxID=3346323 RepID=UPI0036EB65D5
MLLLDHTHSVVVNFPSASLRSQPRSASRFSFERIARFFGHPQLTADLLGHDRRIGPSHHVHDPLAVLWQYRLVGVPLALRHQQHRATRDLAGTPRRRPRFGAQPLGQPTRDPLGDGEFLELVAHILKLLAQLLCLQLQFDLAGRDQSMKVRFCIPGHLTHLPPGSYGQVPRSGRGIRGSLITETATIGEF